uniref:Dentin sialophosphoprotein n=1 Tax=Steinernema glaseri TaxID=37863 RepID=A0A1I7XXC0_9BILA
MNNTAMICRSLAIALFVLPSLGYGAVVPVKTSADFDTIVVSRDQLDSTVYTPVNAAITSSPPDSRTGSTPTMHSENNTHFAGNITVHGREIHGSGEGSGEGSREGDENRGESHGSGESGEDEGSGEGTGNEGSGDVSGENSNLDCLEASGFGEAETIEGSGEVFEHGYMIDNSFQKKSQKKVYTEYLEDDDFETNALDIDNPEATVSPQGAADNETTSYESGRVYVDRSEDQADKMESASEPSDSYRTLAEMLNYTKPDDFEDYGTNSTDVVDGGTDSDEGSAEDYENSDRNEFDYIADALEQNRQRHNHSRAEETLEFLELLRQESTIVDEAMTKAEQYEDEHGNNNANNSSYSAKDQMSNTSISSGDDLIESVAEVLDLLDQSLAEEEDEGAADDIVESRESSFVAVEANDQSSVNVSLNAMESSVTVVAESAQESAPEQNHSFDKTTGMSSLEVTIPTTTTDLSINHVKVPKPDNRTKSDISEETTAYSSQDDSERVPDVHDLSSETSSDLELRIRDKSSETFVEKQVLHLAEIDGYPRSTAESIVASNDHFMTTTSPHAVVLVEQHKVQESKWFPRSDGSVEDDDTTEIRNSNMVARSVSEGDRPRVESADQHLAKHPERITTSTPIVLEMVGPSSYADSEEKPAELPGTSLKTVTLVEEVQSQSLSSTPPTTTTTTTMKTTTSTRKSAIPTVSGGPSSGTFSETPLPPFKNPADVRHKSINFFNMILLDRKRVKQTTHQPSIRTTSTIAKANNAESRYGIQKRLSGRLVDSEVGQLNKVLPTDPVNYVDWPHYDAQIRKNVVAEHVVSSASVNLFSMSVMLATVAAQIILQ